MATLFRPSFRLRKLTRAFDASAFEDGPDACGLVQLRHHARVNLEARGARFAAASFFVDLEDALRDVLPLLRLDTDAPPVLHLLSDDGDMVDDAAKVARARRLFFMSARPPGKLRSRRDTPDHLSYASFVQTPGEHQRESLYLARGARAPPSRRVIRPGARARGPTPLRPPLSHPPSGTES